MSAAKNDPKLPIGGEPRVQLLPQSVRDRSKAAALRRRLAMGVVLAVVVVGGGYGYAFLNNLTAQQRLEAARNETQAILTEQAEYSEGSRAAAQVAGIQAAQTTLTAHEVAWAGVIEQVAMVAPAGTGLGQVVGVGQAPWEPTLPVEGALRAPRVALLTFTFTSPNVLNPASMVPQFSKIPGFVDARFDASIWDDTYAQYETTVRLMLDTRAATGRYAAETTEDEG